MVEREDVIAYLRELSDREFAELFYAAVDGRNTSDIPSEPGHFVLADAQRSEGQWFIDFIAIASKKHGSADDPICEAGACTECGTEVRSWAKHLICPVCRSKGYGT